MTRVRSGRHPARRLALQTLFETDFHPGGGSDAPGARDPRETWGRGAHRAGLSETAAAFAWELVEGVLANRAALDREIAALAPEWPVEQLAPIDRNILRIALFELRMRKETPMAAVIDEAVELAKVFGSEASPKFVNGVLASAVRDDAR
jgi:N utilization substance protein B